MISDDEDKCNENIILTLEPNTDASDVLNRLTDYYYALRNEPAELTDEIRFYKNGEAFINIELFIERRSTEIVEP